METNAADEIINASTVDFRRLQPSHSTPVVVPPAPRKMLSDYVIQPVANAAITVCIYVLSAIVSIALFIQKNGTNNNPQSMPALSVSDTHRARGVIDNLANKIKPDYHLT
ncbi:hypothetical protein GCM10023116_38010 [Kistimonas scapharcae]|uniref:Uncharacterized protein n=1 Tax=Kistimonas scapharcae TaxID=1036133 RepID=A0ABP8V6S8_9GAMM